MACLYPSVELKRKRECIKSWKNDDRNKNINEIFLFKTFLCFREEICIEKKLYIIFIKINKIYINYIYKLYFNIYITFIIYLLTININLLLNLKLWHSIKNILAKDTSVLK